jgi:hypothetical protein
MDGSTESIQKLREAQVKGGFLERTTGFEPATPTLARWCSTN